MKLNELLKKITPLPWLKVECDDGDKWIGTANGDDRIATLDGNTSGNDHDYLVHAANVLPELVEALRELLQVYPQHLELVKNCHCAICRANALLEKAENAQ